MSTRSWMTLLAFTGLVALLPAWLVPTLVAAPRATGSTFPGFTAGQYACSSEHYSNTGYVERA